MSDTSPVSNPASPPGSPTLLGDKQDDDVAFSAFRAKLQAVIAQWDTEKLSEKYIQLMYKMEGQKRQHEYELISASATGEKKGKEAMLAQMDDMTIQCKKAEVLLLLQCKKAEEEKETAEDMVKTLKTEHETALLSASATGENKGKEDMRAQMEDDLKALQRQAGDIANISPKNPDGSVLEELIKKEFIAIGERLEKCNDGRPSPGTGDHMGCDFVNDSKESNGNNDEFGADCDTGIPKLVRDVKRNEKDFGILTAQHLTIKCQSKTYAQMAVVHYHDCLIVLVPGIRHTKTLGTVLKQALELGRQERKCT